MYKNNNFLACVKSKQSIDFKVVAYRIMVLIYFLFFLISRVKTKPKEKGMRRKEIQKLNKHSDVKYLNVKVGLRHLICIQFVMCYIGLYFFEFIMVIANIN